MQRIICMLCEATICLNCGEYCGGFQRNFDLMEIHLFAPANIFQRPGDHTFCKVLTRSSASLSRVGALQYAIITEAYLDALHLSTLIQCINGTGVDTDAHCDAALFTGGHNQFPGVWLPKPTSAYSEYQLPAECGYAF